MKKLVLLIVLVYYSLASSAQNNIRNDSLYFPQNRMDRISNQFWSHYLRLANNKSIYKDTSVVESYRLIYWGKYLGQVQIIRKNNEFIIKKDSSCWGGKNMIFFSSFDTLSNFDMLKNLQAECINLCKIEDSLRVPVYNEIIECSEDDRDNWLLEFKINDYYYVKSYIEVESNFRSIILIIMRLAYFENFDLYTW